MNPADEMAAKIEPTERQSADGVAGSDDTLRLRATLKNLQRISLQSEPVEDLHGFDKLNERREDLLRPSPQRKPVKDLQSLVSEIDRHLDYETSERKIIYDRIRAIDGQMKRLESQTKRRASGAFGRYLVAICIGVAVTLAWQPYGEATKQIIATSAPELGWSPEIKQMIASWIQQPKPPAGPENTVVQAAPVAQTAPETVAPKAPAAPSLDPEQVHQIALDVATLRQTVEQLTASQDQMAREIEKLQIGDMEILAKLPAPSPQRPAAPARKPTPIAPPSSLAPIPPRLPPHP
jgi:hypothetical protein